MDNRELDREIAEKFLGWTDVQWESVGNNQVLRGWQPPGHHRRSGVPYYSSDPKACSLVLDEIERRGWSYVLYYEPLLSKPYRFQFSKRDGGFHASAKHRETAVCLAVCEAVMGAIEEEK
jgi:hypothetical protein